MSKFEVALGGAIYSRMLPTILTETDLAESSVDGCGVAYGMDYGNCNPCSVNSQYKNSEFIINSKMYSVLNHYDYKNATHINSCLHYNTTLRTNTDKKAVLSQR